VGLRAGMVLAGITAKWYYAKHAYSSDECCGG
jgi:hypothetical protein